jgi:hypothetical protein
VLGEGGRTHLRRRAFTFTRPPDTAMAVDGRLAPYFGRGELDKLSSYEARKAEIYQ